MITKKTQQEVLLEFMKENKTVRYAAYGIGGILSIWILGKVSRLLSDAIIGFKQLHQAIKH